MTKTTVTVPCDRCKGSGEMNGGDTCPSCLGQRHVEQMPHAPHMVIVREEVSGKFWPDGSFTNLTPLTPDEAFIYVCAVRYAINRQTYAGSIVAGELQKVVPRMPYSDRKLLEKEIADALFKGEVDPLTREAWENLVTDIQRVEGV